MIKTMSKSLVHVNQHNIRHNHKNNDNLPVIAVKQKGKTIYAWGVAFSGPCVLEYHECDPLSCGARVWITTEEPITLLDQNNKPFNGLSFKEIAKNVQN